VGESATRQLDFVIDHSAYRFAGGGRVEDAWVGRRSAAAWAPTVRVWGSDAIWTRPEGVAPSCERHAKEAVMAIRYVDEDFVAVRRSPDAKARVFATLVFGDPVEVIEERAGWTHVRVICYFEGREDGWVRGRLPVRERGILRLSMVDVQQGDGLILETPGGRVVFIDGGDNKLFARHAAARFLYRGTTAEAPLDVDAIIVTHGDADHFDGLGDIVASERLTGAAARKRLFIRPLRVYHNGLVKGPTEETKDGRKRRIRDEAQLGRTRQVNGWPYIVDLYDDPRRADDAKMNAPFKRWAKHLTHWEQRGPVKLQRLAYGMKENEVFDFLDAEGIKVELQGPFTELVAGADGAKRPALRFMPKPRRGAELHVVEDGAGAEDEGTPSASHTINGHSLAFRLTFGNVRFNFTGDMNREAMRLLRQRLPLEALEAEIVKVPHHGSADFDLDALKAMRPILAIISSGDESSHKEYIHPRATLMAAAGMAMRGRTGLVLCTELAAFFAMQGDAFSREDLVKFFRKQATAKYTGEQLAGLFAGAGVPAGFPRAYLGFERTNFGIIHVRTDGERVLVFTLSGKDGLREAYRFSVTVEGGQRRVQFADSVRTRS
jgi:beta-lactamase superfamily II metal-dependent hydrolase